MPRTGSTSTHADNIRAVSFITDMPVDQIHGYVVIAIDHDGNSLMTSNGATKAATVALAMQPIADLAYEVAEDLRGVLLG